MLFSRRLSAVTLTLALFAGNAAVCAGWAATPEARMACCVGPDCPMHKSESSNSDGQRIVSQAEADSCRALSEGETPGPSTPTFATAAPPAVLIAAVILPVEPPAFVLSEAWRSVIPIPTNPVAKHVLLSVFLL
jgi:hypothetical protein